MEFDDDLVRIARDLELANGVFAPNAGSFALASVVRGRSGSFLDLGTGSGFLSVIISKSAGKLLATDCSPTAVACAKRNFLRLGICAEVRESDMFEHISETFDHIVFNPPFHRESERDRRLKNGLKRVLPAAWRAPLSGVARRIFKYSMRPVVGEFYLQACRHLSPGGSMFVNIMPSDVEWLSEFVAGRARLAEHRRSTELCVVELSPNSARAP